MGFWGNMMNGWGYGPGVNGYGYSGGYWWMGLLGMAFQLIFWLALIGIGVYFYRRYANRIPTGTGTFGRSNALDILRERYARGEIDAEEYQRRRQDLE
ncbi:hypothetical protein JCM15765_13040 [Paradesulfitobacterium aromaticivorans]